MRGFPIPDARAIFQTAWCTIGAKTSPFVTCQSQSAVDRTLCPRQTSAVSGAQDALEQVQHVGVETEPTVTAILEPGNQSDVTAAEIDLCSSIGHSPTTQRPEGDAQGGFPAVQYSESAVCDFQFAAPHASQNRFARFIETGGGRPFRFCGITRGNGRHDRRHDVAVGWALKKPPS